MKLKFRVFYLLLFAVVLLTFWNIKSHFIEWHTEPEIPPNATVILFWTPFMEQTTYVKEIQKYSNENCLKKCFFTADKNKAMNASAIVFHIWDWNDHSMPSQRHPEQYYVYFNWETPLTLNLYDRYKKPNFFNLTMTYRTDSDIPAVYGRFIGINDSSFGEVETWSWSEVKKAVSRKNKFAVQFVTHCNAPSKRDEIVEHLINASFPVDRFGSCPIKNPCRRDRCEPKILPNYYFYLAFENSICQDYVTEKFWRLKKLIVPVVLRRSIAALVAPNDTFIAVDDFDTIEDLAKYLTYLTQNQTAYLKYFEWTKKYQKKNFNWSHGFCELCQKLIDSDLGHKQYADIGKWFNPPGNCDVL